MRLKEMTVTALAEWLLITPAMASEDWRAEAEKWKAEAKRWEAMAKRHEDQYGWCGLNGSLTTFSGYGGPNCFKPLELLCAVWEKM